MRTPVLVAIGATMLLAGCGGGAGDDAGSPVAAPAGSPTPDATAGATTGRPVPLADGGTADLDAFAGQDVLLWFWAPW